MLAKSPRPGETASPQIRASLTTVISEQADQAPLLEELAQVEHELEALAEYRKELREKIDGVEAGDA